MGINLVKGQTIDLKKNETGTDNNLSKITIGLGWDIKKTGSVFGIGGKAENYDLDACAILLDKNGKLTSNSDIVYYGNQKHQSGQIWSNGDNLTGAGDGDDEQIVVKLESLDSKYEKVVFYASIYQGHAKNQHFGNVENAHIRAIDASGKELCKYTLSNDSTLNNKMSFIFGEAYRNNGTWKFRAVGEAKDTDSYAMIAESFK